MIPIRLGVIGLGLIWLRTHKAILQQMPDVFDIVAVCDTSEARRQSAAEDFPAARLFSDYQELLAQPDIDTVLVLTPIAFNAPLARDAIQAGKHVIMEKPIARSVAEGQALIDAANQASRRLFVTEQMAYRPLEDRLKALIDTGEIGELLLWERVLHLEADPAKGAMSYASTPWRKEADFPLGTMFDGGIHVIATLTKVFGHPESVTASGRSLRSGYGDYDHVVINSRAATGVNGMLSFSSFLPPLRNHYHIYGSAGAISVGANEITVSRPAQADQTITFPKKSPYQYMWEAIAQALQENREPAYTPDWALRDVGLLLAVEQALKTGQMVSLTAGMSIG